MPVLLQRLPTGYEKSSRPFYIYREIAFGMVFGFLGCDLVCWRVDGCRLGIQSAARCTPSVHESCTKSSIISNHFQRKMARQVLYDIIPFSKYVFLAWSPAHNAVRQSQVVACLIWAQMAESTWPNPGRLAPSLHAPYASADAAAWFARLVGFP